MSTQVCKNFEVGTWITCGPDIRGQIIGTATYRNGYGQFIFGYVVQLDQGSYLAKRQTVYISSIIIAADAEHLKAE